jgi:phage-related protein
LARYHPAFANLAASMQRQRILLNYQLARSTYASATMQSRATRQMNADLQELRSSFQTLYNFAGTAAAKAAKPLADSALNLAGTFVFGGAIGSWTSRWLPLLTRAAEKYMGAGQDETRRAYGTFMGNVNAGMIQARRPRPKAAEKP